MTTTTSRIETLLHDTMGLDVASIGAAAVERAARARMVACEISTFGEYWILLKESGAELQALIETVVVPETWFQRDPQAFAEVTRVAREQWRTSRPGATRRLLCLPCSTGEEPYSLAMAMLDAGYTPERFCIDAVDISARAIEHARRGVYGRNSFRGQDLAFRDQYFEPAAEGHRVNNSVRRGVRFLQGNVLDKDFALEQVPYDAIFCRNLLIYFDKNDQDRVIRRLGDMLAENGMLFVGPAESNMLAAHDFVSARVPLAFAFRKSSQRVAVPCLQAVSSRVSQAVSAAPEWRPAATPAPAPAAAVALSFDPLHLPLLPDGAPDMMEEAMLLANQGRLQDAQILCEEQLREHGASPDLFHLMGLICSADGEVSAADRYYRKALYLDQNHQPSLLHLALLLEQQGDHRGARLLRSRAQRR